MKWYNNFFLGLGLGLTLPAIFIWIYLIIFYPIKIDIIEILKNLYPSSTLGNLLLLAIVPNLLIVFVFYKQDTFRIAGGIMLGAIVYLIGAIMMS